MAARLTDKTLYAAAGMDPKTGLPTRIGGKCEGLKKDEVRKQLRILDEQDAINAFTWHNLPDGLNGRLLERILYYKGQGAMFKLNDKFYFLPYALQAPDDSSGIDVYGRFTGITPLPFNGTTADKEKPLIKGLTYKPVYDVQTPLNFLDKSDSEIRRFLDESCVILKDYTEQMSQTNISRQVVNDPLLDFMSEMLPFMRTALANSTGITGLRVTSPDEAISVLTANEALIQAALNGQPFVPITGNLDFQLLTKGGTVKAEEFLLCLQALDNYRLSLHGLDNGGLFQKRSHMLEAEQETNSGNTGLVLRDKLQNRQDFCDIFNSIHGLGIWCEPSETVLGMDRDGDMVAGSNESGNSNMATSEEVTIDEDIDG